MSRNISKQSHFTDEEFECRCGCGLYIPNKKLREVLEEFRGFVGVPVYITSGTRCEKHNKNVGGSVNSRHLTGEAADIIVWAMPAHDVYEYFDSKFPNTFGIGEYERFVHIDVRDNRARWGK